MRAGRKGFIMETTKVLGALDQAKAAIAAALASKEISPDTSIGFGIDATGAVTVTVNGKPLTVCGPENSEVMTRWTAFFDADIKERRDKEEKEIREKPDKARDYLKVARTEYEKYKADADKEDAEYEAALKKQAESEAEDEAPMMKLEVGGIEVDTGEENEEKASKSKKNSKLPHKPCHGMMEHYENKVKEAEEDLENAEKALKRLDEENLLSEETEADLKTSEELKAFVLGYISKASAEPAFADAAKLPHKNLSRLLKHVLDTAKKMAGKRGFVGVSDETVCSWISEYMLADDKEACDKEDNEAAKVKERKARDAKKAKYDKAVGAVKAEKREATTATKRGNFEKKQAEEETDPVKKQEHLDKAEKFFKEAAEHKAKAEELAKKVPEKPEVEEKAETKKAESKKETKPSEKKPEAKAKPSKKEKADSPFQMSIFDFMGAAGMASAYMASA